MSRATRLVRHWFARGLPPAALELARTFDRSRRGLPVVGLPEASRALVLAAHPDDESAMAGGTIALLARSGCRVEVLVATGGEASQGTAASVGEIAAARRQEVAAACGVLGASVFKLLGYPDGALEESIDAVASDISDAIELLKPDLVIAPWWMDAHSDHRTLCRALGRAEVPDATTLWLGEIWTPLHPNRLVDISAMVDVKRQALEAHETANRAVSLEAFLGLNRYRSLSGLRGKGYAEAFIELNAGALREAVAASGAVSSDG